jgi:formate dehydrogenase subunit delta
MSHEAGHKSGEQKLVYMANQIAAFFQTMPHEEAADGVADHINKFWEPRMRRRLLAILDAGGEGLAPLVIEAAPKIKRPQQSAA